MNSEPTKNAPKEYLDLVKMWVGDRYALFERPVANILKRRGLIYNWQDLEIKK
jgi:hypothetical protein